jgi:hypothetical protein
MDPTSVDRTVGKDDALIAAVDTDADGHHRLPLSLRRARAAPLAPPLVTFVRHPLKWTRNKAELVVAAVVLAHIGTLIVVGLYYLVFEVYPPFTRAWHTAVASNSTRHLLRNVYEGVLGGTLVQFVVFNHFAKRRVKLGWLDKQEITRRIPNLKDRRPLSGWQLLLSPLLVLVYAIPGFLVGAGVAWLVRHDVTTPGNYAKLVGGSSTGHSLWAPIKSVWTTNRDAKIVGFFASVFLGRRPVRAVADDLQGYLAARRVALGKSQRIYHPPNFRARMNAATKDGSATRLAASAKLVPYLLSFALLTGLALAGFGYWVLAYKA